MPPGGGRGSIRIRDPPASARLFEDEFAAARRPATQLSYQVILDRFERICNPKTLRAITERTVSAFAAGMRKEKLLAGGGSYAPNTIKVAMQHLHTVLVWAEKQKLIPKCPEFPTVKVPKKKPQPVPVEAFERLLAKAGDDQNMRAFLQAGWLGGLRLVEAMLLEREPTTEAPYLDLARDRIIFPAEFGKGDEDQWVPLDATLRRELEALPRHGKKMFRFESKKGEPVKESAVCNRVVSLAERAGVRLTMRSLRRGFGCWYAGKVPAQVLQKLMRHKDISIRMDYYPSAAPPQHSPNDATS
jgi:integrase